MITGVSININTLSNDFLVIPLSPSINQNLRPLRIKDHHHYYVYTNNPIHLFKFTYDHIYIYIHDIINNLYNVYNVYIYIYYIIYIYILYIYISHYNPTMKNNPKPSWHCEAHRVGGVPGFQVGLNAWEPGLKSLFAGDSHEDFVGYLVKEWISYACTYIYIYDRGFPSMRVYPRIVRFESLFHGKSHLEKDDLGVPLF